MKKPRLVGRTQRRGENRRRGKNWKTDLSGGIIRVDHEAHGCMPFGNAARAVAVELPRSGAQAPRAFVLGRGRR